MTYNNLRKGRTSLPSHVYLITTVTAGRRPLFRDLTLGRAIVHAMRAHDDSGDTRTLAFVVMPDHVHWLLQLSGAVSLAHIMKHFKGTTARRINTIRNTNGAVWQPSFHDHAVRGDESLVAIARYVIMNPVRARLATNLGDYSHWDAAWDMSTEL